MESQLCRLLRSLPYVLLLLLCAAFRCAMGTQATSLRGVAPSKLPAYQTRSIFTCTSDQRGISIERVNDDVCDCADGSDEPGTSACANGMFHCRNRGHVPRDLPSTFVDDGVCDCCDGTDETHGCNDSCEALGQFARTDAQAKLHRYVAGAKVRDKLLSEAARKIQGWKERSIQLEETVGQLKPLVAQLHGESIVLCIFCSYIAPVHHYDILNLRSMAVLTVSWVAFQRKWKKLSVCSGRQKRRTKRKQVTKSTPTILRRYQWMIKHMRSLMLMTWLNLKRYAPSSLS